MENIKVGDLVSVERPAIGGVGPIGGSGTVLALNDTEILVESSHTHEAYWRPAGQCRLVLVGEHHRPTSSAQE